MTIYNLILRILLHLAVAAVIIALLAFPSFAIAAYWAETGAFGDCVEGGCGYTAIFLLLPIIWFCTSVAAFALWLRWWSRRQRAK